MRRAVLAVSLLFGLVIPAQAAAAQPADPPKPEAPVNKCAMKDPRLAELSGVLADKDRWYMVNDGGEKATVLVVRKDCTVERQIVGQTDPFDVEDLGRAPDGTFLLADGGDNNLERDTAALIALTPAGKSTLYRLTYPDGKHDAEALLVGANGAPYFVTKDVGNAGVYSPVRQLQSPGPTPMKKVATIKLEATDTPGGPVPGPVGSRTITGGAVSSDGTVVAVRTYTDAYLYAAPDKDIVKALNSEPVRVPLPNEAQGEAIAFEPDGSLVSASERSGEPIRFVNEALELVAPAAAPAEEESEAEKTPESVAPAPAGDLASNNVEKQGLPIVPAAGVAILLMMGVLASLRWRTARSRRRFYRG
ncbi:hypothetical protein [Actinophytocola sp.]|uniref:hypothetical protein n=1 Tax=Actinophytocola sp. TaxID=1872138 RepID=UPI003D6A9F34